MFVVASQSIAKGIEISIPFDYDYKSAPFYTHCACGKYNCPIERFMRRKNSKEEEKDEEIEDELSEEEEPPIEEPVPEEIEKIEEKIEDLETPEQMPKTPPQRKKRHMKNQVIANGQPEVIRRRNSSAGSANYSKKTPPISPQKDQTAEEDESDEELDASPEPKKLTREERKIQQYVHLIQMNEKRDARKKEGRQKRTARFTSGEDEVSH